jgi:flagellar motor protein MotB
MKKVSWLVTGISLLLIIALMGCGYAKRDEVEKQLSDQKMELEQKVQLAQDAAAEASDKADKVLVTARQEISDTKSEIMTTVEQKDSETLTTVRQEMKASDEEVRKAAQNAADKALSEATTVAMAEDEKVKQEAKNAAQKAMNAAEEADRRAQEAAEEAELAKELPKPKEPVVFTVYFNLGQTNLSKDSKEELKKVADAIKAHPEAHVKIEGHTDNVPVVKSGYINNWGLSQARAQAVNNHLVKELGVSADAIDEVLGAAFYKPVAPNSPSGRKLNRRVEVIITPKD